MKHYPAWYQVSICELRARYIAVSSAKSLTLDLTCAGRSSIYTRKSIGPRTEPCGKSEETGIHDLYMIFGQQLCTHIQSYKFFSLFHLPLLSWGLF